MSLLAPADWEFDHEVQHVPPAVEQNGIGVRDTASKIPRELTRTQALLKPVGT